MVTTVQKTFDGGSVAEEPVYNDDGEKRCYECGEYYKSIGHHWNQSGCSYPSVSDYQHELITGLMLGDGNFDNNNSTFRIYMANKTFIKWLWDEMGYITTSTVGHQTDINGFSEGYGKDQYKVNTHPTPELFEYGMWYDTGEKLYPNDLQLTPLILKLWYVSDGGINHKFENQTSNIYISKELGTNKIENLLHQMFSELGWQFNRYEYENGADKMLFNIEDSREMWNYMGDPLPGFEYKWPDNDVTYDDFVEEHTTRGDE